MIVLMMCFVSTRRKNLSVLDNWIMFNTILNGVMPLHSSDDTTNIPPDTPPDIQIIVLPENTPCLYSQCDAITNNATWFVNMACACAFNIRNDAATVPAVFVAQHPLKLVHVINVACVKYMLRCLDNDILHARLSMNNIDSVGTEKDRDTKLALTQTVIRLTRWKHAVHFATGYGDNCRQLQNKILHRICGSNLRRGFNTHIKRNSQMVQFCDEMYGGAAGTLNRCALPLYEHFFARAVQHVFPWAHGYMCGTTASLWHYDQIYPSEVCIFNPAQHVLLSGHVDEYDVIKDAVLGKIKNKPLNPNFFPVCQFCYEYLDFATGEPPNACPKENAHPEENAYPDGNAYPEEVDSISDDMEARVTYLRCDNPLSNNCVQVDLVEYCASVAQPVSGSTLERK